MDKGKDKEKGCVCGCKAYTPGILHELQDNLSPDAFGGVQWTETWMRIKRTELTWFCLTTVYLLVRCEQMSLFECQLCCL